MMHPDWTVAERLAVWATLSAFATFAAICFVRLMVAIWEDFKLTVELEELDALDKELEKRGAGMSVPVVRIVAPGKYEWQEGNA